MSRVVVDTFSGLARNKLGGVYGTFAAGQNLDVHDNPHILKAGQALKKDSGSTVTGLILWFIIDDDGTVYGGDDAGKIWKRTSGGTWSEEKDLGSRICGMIKYNGNYYAATSDTLYRASTVATLASYQTWTGDYIDTEFHPMIIADDNNLYIGAGKYLSKVANVGGGWTADALELPDGWRVRCLSSHDINVQVGCWKGASVNEGKIFPWDGLNNTFFTPITLEGSCNAMLTINGTPVVQAGNRGNVYYIANGKASPIVNIPGTYTDTKKINVNPDAVANVGGLLHFGLGEFTAGQEAAPHGVYTFGSKNIMDGQTLNLEYTISTDTTAGVNIGSILKIGEDMLISWEDGGTYGVDIIDWANKKDGAVYESVMLYKGKPIKRTTQIMLTFNPLPASTSITVKYKTDNAASWTTPQDATTGVANTTGQTVLEINETIESDSIELQITLGTNSNDTPEILTAELVVYPEYERK